MQPFGAHLFRSLKGAALVEYGILVGIIAVGAITSVLALGGQIGGSFIAADTALRTAQEQAAATPTPETPQTPAVREIILFAIVGPGDDAILTNTGTGNARVRSQGQETTSILEAPDTVDLIADLPREACHIHTATLRFVQRSPYAAGTVDLAWSGNGHVAYQSYIVDDNPDASYPNGLGVWINTTTGAISATLPGC